MGQASICLFSFFFHNFSRIRTQIVGEEGEHSYHYNGMNYYHPLQFNIFSMDSRNAKKSLYGSEKPEFWLFCLPIQKSVEVVVEGCNTSSNTSNTGSGRGCKRKEVDGNRCGSLNKQKTFLKFQKTAFCFLIEREWEREKFCWTTAKGFLTCCRAPSSWLWRRRFERKERRKRTSLYDAQLLLLSKIPQRYLEQLLQAKVCSNLLHIFQSLSLSLSCKCWCHSL